MNQTRLHLAVTKPTYELITKKCVEEFLKFNPEFKGIKISHNFIIEKIGKHYLESEPR